MALELFPNASFLDDDQSVSTSELIPWMAPEVLTNASHLDDDQSVTES